MAMSGRNDFKRVIISAVTAISALAAQFGPVAAVAEAAATESSTNTIFCDTFDSYSTVDGVGKNWTLSSSGNIFMDGNDGENKALKMTSASDNSITKTFAPITDNVISVEMSLKTTGGFNVFLTDNNNNEITVAGVDSYRKVGYYPRNDSRKMTVSGITLPAEEYKRLKITVDRQSNKLKLTTTKQSEEFDISYVLGNITAVSIKTLDTIQSATYIDEIKVTSGTPSHNGASVTFGSGTKDYTDAWFYSAKGIGEDGITLKPIGDMLTKPSGVTYYMFKKVDGEIAIELDADSGINCDDFNDVCVEFEYVDSGYGFVLTEYDTKSGAVETPAVCLINSGNVKTQSMVINDWVKNSTTGGYKLKIKTFEGNRYDGEIHTGDRTYSKYPVTIKSVRIYNTGTHSPVDIGITTNNTGNIFFEGETPTFKIAMQNNSNTVLSGNCQIECYLKNKDNTDVGERETLQYSTSVGVNLASGGNSELEIAVPVTKFGLYTVKTEFVDSNNTISCTDETDFSKCMEVSSLNKTIGLAAHFTLKGDSDAGLGLFKKAGLGLVRDDFYWYHYEKKPGVYGFTPAMEEFCDAAAKYDIEVLPILNGNVATKSDGTYTSGSGFPSQTDVETKFNTYVTKLLNEPKLKAVAKGVEIWNEPDITGAQGGVYLEDSQVMAEAGDTAKATRKARGEAYGNMLVSVAENIKANAPGYKIGAFAICTPWNPETNYFMDAALSQIPSNKKDLFDAITLHPYMALNVDPEIGVCGKESGASTNAQKAFDSISYRMDNVKALVTGGTVYNHYSNENEKQMGMITGNTYSQTLTEPLWITEYGVSSASYKQDGLGCGNEYDQAIWLIRGLNQIKLNNINNKVWFYDFADDGDRINEKEHCFGVVHSITNAVPYSAKYAYLSLASFNKLTEGATSVAEVKNDAYRFITKYNSNNRNTYMLWTTKSDEQTISYDFGANVKYYDLLGNEISESEIKTNEGYRLTREPYYAVTGEQPNVVEADKQTAGLYFAKDGIGVSISDAKAMNDKFDIFVNLSGVQKDAQLFAAAYNADGRFLNVTMRDVTSNTNYTTVPGISFAEKDIKKIKFMLLYKNTVIPLCDSLSHTSE